MIRCTRGCAREGAGLLEQKQAVAAEVPEELAQSDAASYALSPDERTAVREAVTRAKQGKFAPPVEVDATLRRPWC